jgi:phosphate transport system permease protein
MAPRDNGLLVASQRGLSQWKLNPQHPEVTLRALFLPLWYEGYEQPEWVWQSSSGSDEFEPKLGLMPLIFGTLKATVYSMLFGVPLALCAAVYTSEFLPPKAKARIKPGIEMMASLPSVVLGFLAALVIAPFVEDIVPTLITGMFAVPFVFLLAAYTWQLLPAPWTVRWAPWRFLFICATLPLGILFAVAVGPLVEGWLFSGDLRAWLDGRRGSGTGGWVIMLLPLCGVAVAWILTQRINPWLRAASAEWSRTQRAGLDLGKFLLGTLITVLLAWLLASLLTAMGFDPRGSLVGTYVQRNALVVGFVMGFAIVPIIYTIADDALSTVPEHLRSASLGAGATPWQTATRIIIPTAMSGLFSAVMIGLGRAVGETMIVLMAAGNTSIMDWNVFNGFQTLSALIATELPEAVRNSTHYRTLFLAALTLFILTFIVNTVAEVIRLRFRRRAYEL